MDLAEHRLSRRFSGLSDDRTCYTAHHGSFGTINPIWTFSFSQGSSISLDLDKSPHPASPCRITDRNLNPSTETSSAADGLDECLHLKSPTPVQNTVERPSPDEIMSFADQSDSENNGADGITKENQIVKAVEKDKPSSPLHITSNKSVDDVYEFTEQDETEEDEDISADEDPPVDELNKSAFNPSLKVVNTAYEIMKCSWQYMIGDLVYVQANLPRISGRPFWLQARIHRKVLMMETPFYWIEYIDRYRDYRPKAKWISGDKLLLSAQRARGMVLRDNVQFQLAVKLAKADEQPLTDTDRPVDTKRVKRT